MNHRLRPSRVEIDEQALARNCRLIKTMIGNDCKMMAIVKADGYGHGAANVARVVLRNGAEYLGVASIAEALELRDAGIEAPILVLTYMCADAVPQAIAYNIAISIFDFDMLRLMDQAARASRGVLRAHLKIDSGMGRLGVMPGEVGEFLRRIETSHIHFEGIYTHFSVADEDPLYTDQQARTFKQAVRALRSDGFCFEYVHCSNSAGVLTVRDDFFNLARPGLILYGLKPSRKFSFSPDFRAVMAWKTTIVQVRTFPPDYPIGYGNTYYTKGRERIAILPVGYADGLRRSPHTWREVLIHGRRAPLVGRVSMEKIAVNVSHIPKARVGDEAVLLGKQGDDEITADEVASWLGTINYEVITSILPRVPRQ